jgi:hypothetical protein
LDRLERFTWTPDSDRWLGTFDQVAAFVAANGRIPTRGDDPLLAGWLAAQRLYLRKCKLDADRSEALEQLPGWAESLSTPRASGQWEARLSELTAFQNKHGFYPDRAADAPAESELGQWAHQQRAFYQRGDLSARRAAELEALPNWRWRTRDATFDRNIHALRRELSSGSVSRDHPLYRWVESQRRRHQGGRLSVEQSAALAELGLLDEVLPDVLTAA